LQTSKESPLLFTAIKHGDFSLPRARHQLLVKAFLGKLFRARAYNPARGCNRCTTGILVLIDDSP
jgi:hypothetical protein